MIFNSTGMTIWIFLIPGNLDMGRGDYTIAVRFQTRHGGTLFAETQPGEKWVPDGKSLFVRGGRLVFDIGWVGAVESRRHVDDGEWHEAVMTYESQSHWRPSSSTAVAKRKSGSRRERRSRIASTGSDSQHPTSPSPTATSRAKSTRSDSTPGH